MNRERAERERRMQEMATMAQREAQMLRRLATAQASSWGGCNKGEKEGDERGGLGGGTCQQGAREVGIGGKM